MKYHLFSLFSGLFYSLGFPSAITEKTYFLVALFGLALFFHSQNKLVYFKHKYLAVLFFLIPFHFNVFNWLHIGTQRYNSFASELNIPVGILLFITQHLHFLLIPLIIYIGLKLPIKYKLHITSLLLTLNEILLGQIFPVHAGYILTPLTEYLSLLSVFGIYIYSYFIHFIILFLLEKKFIYTKKEILIALLVVFTHFVPGYFLPETENINPQSIALVQSGTMNYFPYSDMSRNLEHIDIEMDKVSTLISKLDNTNYSLVVFGESFYPFFNFVPPNNKDELPKIFHKITTKSDIAFGAITQEQVGDDYFRDGIFVHYDSKLKGIRSKLKLTDYSEDIDNKFILNYINKNKDLYSQYLPAKRRHRKNSFDLNSQLVYAPLICWEALFPFFIQKNIQPFPVSFLLNIANESWFYSTNEQRLHNFLLTPRAHEFATPLLKVARTGTSTILDTKGREINSLGDSKRGILSTTITHRNTTRSLFHRFGILPLLFLWLLIIIFLGVKKNE